MSGLCMRCTGKCPSSALLRLVPKLIQEPNNEGSAINIGGFENHGSGAVERGNWRWDGVGVEYGIERMNWRDEWEGQCGWSEHGTTLGVESEEAMGDGRRRGHGRYGMEKRLGVIIGLGGTFVLFVEGGGEKRIRACRLTDNYYAPRLRLLFLNLSLLYSATSAGEGMDCG
ncbi:hypothetical protein P154DRAFT_11766 [Amniculicola lignicola CBS 123094]|uniref:Uncharacterized protein n=1 Tax=Amniculicola lignicola CBS 123094 TaxID=1392246 RepID=A0A6A5X4N1_9PLEO|nr:hypothetical protein P154DRAFT_11766 [Amniculicola lignicola CBS 123094]